ncbi:MAG: TRAP transporter large permease [Myxococcota bacterium]|nr:TRAP transporter large permease [Myxococcota bacterium]
MSDVALLAACLVALLLARVPVAFAIGLATALTLLRSVPPEPALVTVAQRLATSLDSFALLAIPFFILAGELMNRGGCARRLIDFARVLLGGLPGGLAHVHVLASTLFGAISGSAVAAASAVGGVMGPRMREEGYDRDFSAAVNISAATTGLVVPPSNVLIIYSLASGGVSIAALFLAGYVPGLLVAAALMAAAALELRRSRGHVASTEHDGLLRAFARALPSLGLPVLVMGGIVGGVCTATEASAVAVVYALALALAYREVRVAELPEILVEAGATTGIVMILVGTSAGLSWILAYDRVPQGVAEALLSLGDSPLAVLLAINLTLLVVGTFMDMTPAVLIFTPIFLPVVTALGIDPVHFGIIMVLNLCIGLCTPPVGSVLFVGCAVARTAVTKVVPPLLPMYLAMLLVLFFVTFVPELSLWLPGWLGQ